MKSVTEMGDIVQHSQKAPEATNADIQAQFKRLDSSIHNLDKVVTFVHRSMFLLKHNINEVKEDCSLWKTTLNLLRSHTF